MSKKSRFCVVVLTLLGLTGAVALTNILSNGQMVYSLLFVPLAIAIFLEEKYFVGKMILVEQAAKRKKMLWFGGVLALLLAGTELYGAQLKVNGMTECGFVGKGKIVLFAICLSAVFLPLFTSFFGFLDYLQEHPASMPVPDFFAAWNEKIRERDLLAKHKLPTTNGKRFLLAWGLLLLCYVPVWLAYYPAVMAHDFSRQFGNALQGTQYFFPQHPVSHTFLIYLGVLIGRATGSMEFGIVCHIWFQMLLLSLAFAYGTVMVYRLISERFLLVKRGMYWAMLAFFGLHPFISVTVVSITKDVIFAGLFLILVCLFIEKLFYPKTGMKQVLLNIAIVLEASLAALFRSNGIHAICFFAIFFVLITPGIKKRIGALALAACMVVGGVLAGKAALYACGVTYSGSPIEQYSSILMTFARVGYYHEEELTPKQYEIINKYVPLEYCHNYYAPVADGVKSWVGMFVYKDTWEGHMGELLKDWAYIGTCYPNEYLDAFLSLNAGFWSFEDTTWAEAFNVGDAKRMGAVFTFNYDTTWFVENGFLEKPLEHHSLFPALEWVLEKIDTDNVFYNWPVVNLLFMPAFYSWCLLTILAGAIYRKRYSVFMLATLPTGYLGTMFLGPCVLFRYIFPIMVVVPIFATLLLTNSLTFVGDNRKIS